MMKTANLTKAARAALIGVGTDRQGASIPARTSVEVAKELMDAGFIARGWGLTRTGSVMRQRLVRDELDKAF